MSRFTAPLGSHELTRVQQLAAELPDDSSWGDITTDHPDASFKWLEDNVTGKRQKVLQLEALALELSKQVEVGERYVRQRRSEMDDSVAGLHEKRVAHEKRHTARLRELREIVEHEEVHQAALEDEWRLLEDAITSNDFHVDSERQRLRDLLAQADARDAVIREQQRALTARERDIEARRRVMTHKAERLRALDSHFLAALHAQLREREALIDSHTG
jgi:hypothetical protein